MKALSLASLFLISSTTAIASISVLPNHYTCHGEGVELVYDTSSFAGNQVFFVQEGDAERPLRGAGDEVRVQDTILGKLVSMGTGYVPDLMSTYASIVIPRIHMQDTSKPVSFNSLFVTTKKMTSFGGPNWVVGLVDHSEAKPVSCVAQLVHF